MENNSQWVCLEGNSFPLIAFYLQNKAIANIEDCPSKYYDIPLQQMEISYLIYIKIIHPNKFLKFCRQHKQHKNEKEIKMP